MKAESKESGMNSTPVIIPEGFESILNPTQRKSRRFNRLVGESALTIVQGRNPFYRRLEIIGVEAEVIAHDPHATEEQKKMSHQRISETAGRIVSGKDPQPLRQSH